jgi:hypothetical protein
VNELVGSEAREAEIAACELAGNGGTPGVVVLDVLDHRVLAVGMRRGSIV